MINLIKKLFAGDSRPEEENSRQRKEENDFDILKYDGIRATHIGKWIYAEKCFKEALHIRPDAETFIMLAHTSIRLDKPEQAHDVLVRMTEAYPENMQALTELARICHTLGRYDEMLDTTRKAIGLDKSNAISYYLQAMAHHATGNMIATIAALTQAVSRKEDFAEAYLMRGKVLLEMQQTGEAQADVQTLLELAPDNEEALLLAGAISEAQNNRDEAIARYREAVKVNPFNENAYLQTARLLAQSEQWEEAIRTLDEAIDINAGPALYQLRSKLKLEQGDKEGSIEDMKKALELAPEQENAINGQFSNQEK